MTLVDSNVLIDVMTDDPLWYDWSFARIEEALSRGPLFINDVIYAECSIRFPLIEDYDKALSAARVSIALIPPLALFLAGKVFTQYRRAGGIRTGVLPDFFIGAHAVVEGVPLLTRDGRRYRHYFPTIQLIAPDVS